MHAGAPFACASCRGSRAPVTGAADDDPALRSAASRAMRERGGDPYLHHPALRGRIVDPATSLLPQLPPADLDARMAELGRPPTGASATRRSRRRARLPRRPARPRPLGLRLRLADVGPGHPLRRGPPGAGRRLRAPLHPQGHLGARGTPEAPGMQAALDVGEAATGSPSASPRPRSRPRPASLAPRVIARSTGRSSSRPRTAAGRSKPWQRQPTTTRHHPPRPRPRRAGALPRHRRRHARHQPAYIETSPASSPPSASRIRGREPPRRGPRLRRHRG